jgi:hypothetical protein
MARSRSSRIPANLEWLQNPAWLQPPLALALALTHAVGLDQTELLPVRVLMTLESTIKQHHRSQTAACKLAFQILDITITLS